MITQRYEFPSKLIGLPIVLLNLAIITAPVRAAPVDIFMNIDGVPGESTDDGHKDWIEIGSLGMGVARTRDTSGGSGSGTSSFVAKDLVFTKELDKSTPKLFEAITNGDFFSEVEIDFQTRNGNTTLVFFEIDLINVGVSELSLAGDTELGVAIAGSLHYEEITVIYKPVDEDGKPGPKIEVTWNLDELGGASSVAALIGLGLGGPPVVVPLPGAVRCGCSARLCWRWRVRACAGVAFKVGAVTAVDLSAMKIVAPRHQTRALPTSF